MTPLTPEHFDEAERLHQAATKGPFHTGGTFNPGTPEAFKYVYPPVEPGKQSSNPVAINVPVAVADLFAFMRNHGPDAFRELKAARERIAELEKIIADMKPMLELGIKVFNQ